MATTIILLLSLVGFCAATSSLSIMVARGKDECFYLPKTSGETITASFQIMEGDNIDFAIYDPRNNVIYELKNTDGYELEQKVHIGGDYSFCFRNRHSRGPLGVHFEWDFHLGSQEEATFTKKLEEEKRRYLMNKIKENKPKVISKLADGVNAGDIKPVEMHGQEQEQYEELEMGTLSHALLLISFNTDRIRHLMNLHKSKQAFSHNIQIRNNDYINYFSIVVCFTVFVMALVQVVMVKSFFAGKINIKFWQF